MDQQEETTEQINKKRRIQSPSTSSFPLDLISEILSKLPVKSVGRFRCVSKLWSSITTDPYFINKLETQSRQKKPSLLVFFRRDDMLFVYSIPQDRQSSNEPHSIASQTVHSYHMTYPKSCHFLPNVSVHGLICFPNEENLMIGNPTIRKFLTLTKPEKSWKGLKVFLGYDPISAKHKVLCMPCNETIDKCRVCTLGSAQESWRKVKTNHLPSLFHINYECINGVLYYVAIYSDQTESIGIIIMSFDLRSEMFHMIKLPWNKIIGGRGGIVRLQQYEGKLACLTSDFSGQNITLWILQDAEKHVWSSKIFHTPPSYYDRSLEIRFKLIGITDAGELVYAPNWLYKSFYISYYDPKRNKFHTVEYKGIAEDESRLKNGLERSCEFEIHTVLNHKDSLMSL